MENGKDFVPPLLRKRADKAPVYFFWCAHCSNEADGYTISDIDNPPHTAALNVYCHGKSIHIGIESMPSFREMMAPHEIHPDNLVDPSPFTLFRPEGDFTTKGMHAHRRQPLDL